ncbi:hypothetical protein F5882DRAFT_461698 [Hyaloscypha sp. PMI_1271]|nr:hypothetical protein F5882DRAFT_461698 [Hyaloscypha sp. PMI_1271]
MDGMMDDEEQYGIIMARVPLLYQEWALTKRDVCADAIPGTKTSICTPGNTLCCTPNNTNSAFPQCQTILSSGYCCISANACYIDTPSDCAASNSVPCKMLAAGTTQACCPPFTTCPSSFNQSSTVRCNLAQNVVSSSTSSTKSSTTTSSTKSSVSSATSSKTTSQASDPLSPVSATANAASPTGTTTASSSGLSPGADAGIGVGVAIVVLAIAALAFLAYRRGKKKGAAARAAEAQAAPGTQMSPVVGQQQYYDPAKYSDTPPFQQGVQQHELPSQTTHGRPAELGAGHEQHELP